MSQRKNQRRLQNSGNLAKVRRSAQRATQALDQLRNPAAPHHDVDEEQLPREDPVVWLFLTAYRGFATKTLTVCPHIKSAPADDQPTAVWDSAHPTHLYCEHCDPTAIAFRLQVYGLLPTRCICLAPATRFIRVAAGGLIMICRVCDPCSQRPEPQGVQ